ncbi:MAG TPA: GNAT family N-acetyltransferase [Firmicutes bacterium]|nr:GNAT family N-acetyltransferase [Bacillota bacterium]
MLLRQHNVVLEGVTPLGAIVRLRPITEGDWPYLEKWNSDPEVLYFSEGNDIKSWSPEEVRSIYRTVSQHAFRFIIEYQGKPVGECWLQEMNLEEINAKYPRQDVRRTQIMIDEKNYWGMGIGSTAIRLLTEFAFISQGVDLIYIPGIADYNTRSMTAFQKTGF